MELQQQQIWHELSSAVGRLGLLCTVPPCLRCTGPRTCVVLPDPVSPTMMTIWCSATACTAALQHLSNRAEGS